MEVLREFTSAQELLNWLINFNREDFYFRGISNERQLYPSIMRSIVGDLSCGEQRLLHEFSKYGSSLIVGVNNAFDYISCAQHFGLPTRLVDWTRNPLVALFFAIYYSDQPGCETPMILCLPERKTMPINEPIHFLISGEEQMRYSNPIYDYTLFIQQVEAGNFPKICLEAAKVLHDIRDKSGDYANRIFDNDSKGFMIVVNTGYSNSRLLAQDGLFYLPRRLNKNDIDREYNSSSVQYIPVVPEWRTEILNTLEKLGISQYKLFFDLVNINKYIIEKIKTELEEIEVGFHFADLLED